MRESLGTLDHFQIVFTLMEWQTLSLTILFTPCRNTFSEILGIDNLKQPLAALLAFSSGRNIIIWLSLSLSLKNREIHTAVREKFHILNICVWWLQRICGRWLQRICGRWLRRICGGWVGGVKWENNATLWPILQAETC